MLGAAREEIALSLNGKKSNLQKKDLIDYFAKDKLGLQPKVIESQLGKIEQVQPKWHELVNRSFLSQDLKEQYFTLVTRSMLFISISVNSLYACGL